MPDVLTDADIAKADAKPLTDADIAEADKKQPNWMDGVQRAFSNFWQQVNPVEGLKGLAQATSHPLDALKAYGEQNNELLNKAEDAFKKGDYAMGFHHGLSYLLNGLPGIGASYDKAATQANEGDVPAALGTSAGIATNLLAPEAAKRVPATVKSAVGKAAEGVPERMYQSALKPSTANSAEETRGLVQTGLNAGIPVSEGGVQKLNGLISDLSDKIKSRIAAEAQGGTTIDPEKVAQRTDQVSSKFSKQVNPGSDLQAIEGVKKEFLAGPGAGPIPADLAQDLKVGTYQQLRKKYGELKSAQVESEKALARGLKEELENQIPELKGLNAQQADQLELLPVLERAVNRIANHNLLGIGAPIVGGAVGGAEGAGAGIAAGVMKSILDNPQIKSRFAIAIHRATKAGPNPISVAGGLARLNAVAKSLGQNVTQMPSPSSPSAPTQLPNAAQNDQPGVDRIRGSIDVPLSDQGRQEAQNLANRIAANGGADEIYASPLSRTMETGQAIQDAVDGKKANR